MVSASTTGGLNNYFKSVTQLQPLRLSLELVTRTASRSLNSALFKHCAWCGEPIYGQYFDMHHWYTKRGMRPHSQYSAVNRVWNVVPLHYNCHRQFGQTTEMYERCYKYVAATIGKDLLEEAICQ